MDYDLMYLGGEFVKNPDNFTEVLELQEEGN